MFRLIETIRLENGDFDNLEYHQRRINLSLQNLFSSFRAIELKTLLDNSNPPSSGLFKCRLTYDERKHQLEYEPYTIRAITSLKVVEANTIMYPFKYSDRSMLNILFSKREEADDVLIVKNGMVTDTSYANIVFKREDQWITPANCLLKGTMRQYLLDSKKIKEEVILSIDVRTFEKFKLINAMLRWEGAEVDTINII
jgi:4-amino-4-deoxychorismate lyase